MKILFSRTIFKAIAMIGIKASIVVKNINRNKRRKCYRIVTQNN
jgi:hypothetical protein